MKKKILFLCTGNSARSQMAEGLLRHLAGDKFEVFSAGINPTRIVLPNSYKEGTNPTSVNPLAIKVMDEIGIDISRQRSKSINGFLNQNFDYVITVCDAEWSKSESDTSAQVCPVFPGKYESIHWGLEDPAQVQGTEEERLKVFRRIRNQIKEEILKFLNFPKDKSNLKCPYCRCIQEVVIPQNSCLHLYECKACHRIITPTPESCCVICAYSDKNCPAFVN